MVDSVRTNFKAFVLALVTIFAVALGVSCQIGLGTSVDTQAPVMAITSPSTNSAVSGKNVVFTGSYTDDKGLKSVNFMLYQRNENSIERTKLWETPVVITDKTDKETFGVLTPNTTNAQNGVWEYHMDSTEFEDGSYTLIVTGYDGTYTSVECERNFDIDNTAPVVLLSSPNSINIADPASSGSTLTITGDIGDDHSISLIEVQLYSILDTTKPITFQQYDENGTLFETDTLKYKNVNVSGGTKITVAQFNSVIKDFETQHPGEAYTDIKAQNLHKVYSAIYDGQSDTAYCYAYIQVTDSAGNKTDNTWILNTLLNELKESSIDVTVIKECLKGTYSDSSYSNRVLQILDANKTGLRDGVFDVRKLYAISINSDIDPRYEFSGFSTAGGIFQTTNDGGTLNIQVRAGRNGYGVIPNSIKVIIYDCNVDNKSGEPLNTKAGWRADITSDTLYSDSVAISTLSTPTTNSSYSFNLPSLPNGYYLIEATGKDSQGQSLTADSTYGFRIQSNMKLPTIKSLKMTDADSTEALKNELLAWAKANPTRLSDLGDVTTAGGTEKQFVLFRIEATSNTEDALKAVHVTLNEVEYAATLDEDDGYYYTEPINVSGIPTGNYTASFQAVAQGDTAVSKEKYIQICNQGPTITFVTPEKGSTSSYTSEITFLGTSYSTYSTVKNVKYMVVDNSIYDTYKTGNDSSLISIVEAYSGGVTNDGDSSKWSFTFEPFGNDKTSSYTKILADSPGKNKQVYTLPILFLAEDALGNKTLEKNYKILYDPNADRPTTQIIYPESGKKLCGGVRVSGSATDNKSVKEVYIQIDVNQDGLYNATDATILSSLKDGDGNKIYTVRYASDLAGADLSADANFWGIKANGTVSWYIPINNSGELSGISEAISANGNAVFSIRATALDNQSLLGLWSEEVKLEIDPDAPSITNIQMKQYSDAGLTTVTGEKTYKDSVSVKGEWYLLLDTYDASGISDMYYKVAGNASDLSTAETTRDFVKTSYSGTEIKKVNGVDKSVPVTGYSVKIPLDTGSGTGTKFIRFISMDASEDKSNATYDFIIKYDNEAPDQKQENKSYLYDISSGDKDFFPLTGQKLKISNHAVSFKGYVTDTGSGFSKAIFYFRRVVNGTTTIELPAPKLISAADSEYQSDSNSKIVYTVQSSEIKLASGASKVNAVYKDSETKLYGVTLTGATRSSGTTFTHSLVSSYKFIRPGAVVKIGNSFHTVASVSGNTITFTESVGTNFKEAFFPMAFVVDNFGSEVSYWTSGVNTITNDDGDGVYESISSLSTTYWKWQVSLYADELEDGPINIDVVVMDDAENYSAPTTTSVMLANHTPRISKAYVAVDINGNGKFEDSELAQTEVDGEKVSYIPVAGSNVAPETVTIGSTSIKMINQMGVALEMLGSTGSQGYGSGNGTLYYTAGISTTALSAPVVSGSMTTFTTTNKFSTTDTISKTLSGLNKIYFTSSDVSGDDGNYFINISIADSTKGIALGTKDVSSKKNNITYYTTYGSQATALNIPFVVDLKDESEPKVVVDDLYWNSYNDNSLYNNSSANGHIELSADLPSSFTTSKTGVDDRDSKVSGKISITGSSFDDQQLDSIWINITGFTPESGTYLASATKNLNGDKTFYKVAQNGASWTKASAALTTKGYAFNVITDSSKGAYFGQEGNKVLWQLDFDTEKVTNHAAVDVVISILAMDKAGNQSVYTVNNTAGDATLNKPTMKVDIVPYVTELVTKLSSLDKKTHSTYGRSALGSYPVYFYDNNASYSGDVGETVTVNGFNLEDGVVTMQGGTASITDGKFVVPSTAKSGDIYVTVSGIQTLNNKNNNSAKGSHTGLITEETYDNLRSFYNRQPNNTTNLNLTDDLSITVWGLNSQAAIPLSGDLLELKMHANPNNGLLGFAFAQGTDRANYPYGTTNSYNLWARGWTSVNTIEYVFDGAGNMFGVHAGTDTYTPDKKASRFRLCSSLWGPTYTSGSVTDSTSCYANYRSLRLEYMAVHNFNGYEFVAKAERFKDPKLAASIPAASSSSTNLYLLYYDSILDELKFRAGNVPHSTTTIDRNGGGFKKANTTFGDFVDDAYQAQSNYNTDYAHVSVVANTDSTYKPSEKYAVAIVPDVKIGDDTVDVAVIVWNDSINRQLVYSYLVDPINKNHTNQNATTHLNSDWTTNAKVLGGNANACAITVDKNKHIHIAANMDGGLQYIYLNAYNSSYDSTKDCVAVDSYGATGTYLNMEVALNSSGKAIPYISYYSSSTLYPKYAYLSDTTSSGARGNSTWAPKAGCNSEDSFTGAWECMSIPTQSSILLDDMQIAVWRDSDGKIQAIPAIDDYSVSDSSGKCGGNGTTNPVIGYQIIYRGTGYAETAQLK